MTDPEKQIGEKLLAPTQIKLNSKKKIAIVTFSFNSFCKTNLPFVSDQICFMKCIYEIRFVIKLTINLDSSIFSKPLCFF